MITFTKLEVFGWEAAIRGMRNPYDSWNKSDSHYDTHGDYILGQNDLKLAKSLHVSGQVHSKYKRFILISLDITAPIYWWKEFDTYKVGTASNSCSTMHRMMSQPFHRDMFSHDELTEESLLVLDGTINVLNEYREKYQDSMISRDEKLSIWNQVLQLLPSSFNQKRTVLLNYEVATNIVSSRANHRLKEWREFCEYIVINCPYADDIILHSV